MNCATKLSSISWIGQHAYDLSKEPLSNKITHVSIALRGPSGELKHIDITDGGSKQ